MMFTVELNDDEAATVWRLAALSGLPAAQIVRALHRSHPLFRLAVAFCTEAGESYDEASGRMVPMEPGERETAFRELARSMMGLPQVDQP